MGMFNDLMTKIFRHAANAVAPPDAAKPGVTPESRVTAAANQAAAAKTVTPVDVAVNLDKLAAAKQEKLDWKQSIVDLMKLVGMDSSITARKSLAADLHYTGDTNDSATMNIWLHKQVMQKLAENGGKVPVELLAY